MVQSHTTISLYVRVIHFEVSRVDPLWQGGILPLGRYGGGWGPTRLTTDELWDVTQRGTTELHVDWGGYWLPLELPIDTDEAHRSDRVVMMDMPLPTWGETKPAFKKAA